MTQDATGHDHATHTRQRTETASIDDACRPRAPASGDDHAEDTNKRSCKSIAHRWTMIRLIEQAAKFQIHLHSLGDKLALTNAPTTCRLPNSNRPSVRGGPLLRRHAASSGWGTARCRRTGRPWPRRARGSVAALHAMVATGSRPPNRSDGVPLAPSAVRLALGDAHAFDSAPCFPNVSVPSVPPAAGTSARPHDTRSGLRRRGAVRTRA